MYKAYNTVKHRSFSVFFFGFIYFMSSKQKIWLAYPNDSLAVDVRERLCHSFVHLKISGETIN